MVFVYKITKEAIYNFVVVTNLKYRTCDIIKGEDYWDVITTSTNSNISETLNESTVVEKCNNSNTKHDNKQLNESHQHKSLTIGGSSWPPSMQTRHKQDNS